MAMTKAVSAASAVTGAGAVEMKKAATMTKVAVTARAMLRANAVVTYQLQSVAPYSSEMVCAARTSMKRGSGAQRRIGSSFITSERLLAPANTARRIFRCAAERTTSSQRRWISAWKRRG